MSSFISLEETRLERQFIERGYIVQETESKLELSYLLSLVQPFEPASTIGLNEMKLEAMARLNCSDKSRPGYYFLAKSLLNAIVGNELAMQKRFNLSVQVPNDEANLLPIHADSWAGDSPFQVVLWVPLTDCVRTQSMWILPPEHAKSFRLEGSSEEMFKRIESKVVFVPIEYGEVMVFNPNLPHGNVVNREATTRWSLNCRFKSVFSPYARKELGEHFEPITLRAASRIGLDYRFPA